MASTSTLDVATFPGGRHRAPVPTLTLFNLTYHAWAWIRWTGAVLMWFKQHLDAIEDRALTSKYAPVPIVIFGGTILIAVLGWIANS